MSTENYKYVTNTMGGEISGIGLANGSFIVAQAARDKDDMPRLYERLSEKIKNAPKGNEEIRQSEEGSWRIRTSEAREGLPIRAIVPCRRNTRRLQRSGI
jgi:hypothetical protein